MHQEIRLDVEMVLVQQRVVQPAIPVDDGLLPFVNRGSGAK